MGALIVLFVRIGQYLVVEAFVAGSAKIALIGIEKLKRGYTKGVSTVLLAC